MATGSISASAFGRVRAQWLREATEAKALAARLDAQIADLDASWNGLRTSGPTVARRVAIAIEPQHGAFSTCDICESILATGDIEDSATLRANANAELMKLVSVGQLELVERGRGRRPSTFQKVSP